MFITELPLIIDTAGYQRRVWKFDYKEVTYYVQETSASYYILRQTEAGWHPVGKSETEQIIIAFEKERGPDHSGLR